MYFQTLAMYDTLKYRFSDIPEPDWTDVLDVIKRMGQSMYLIEDSTTGQIVAEFALENWTGRACQSHFSTVPTTDITSAERIEIGRQAIAHMFSLTHPETGEPILDALYGLTPLSNRAACIFALKIGYKKQGILPSGILVDDKPMDCMISVCSRKEMN